MSVEDRIATLRLRHADLETAINEEIARPLPDETHLGNLKRRKLRIKDSIAALMRDGGTVPQEASTRL